MRSDNDSQSTFQSNPKVLDGVEAGALRRPVKFFHTKLGKQFLDRCDEAEEGDEADTQIQPLNWDETAYIIMYIKVALRAAK